MSYTADDASLSSGQPVELYTFTGPGRAYYYTSHDVDVDYDGNTYVSVPMARTSLRAATGEDPPSLEVELPITARFVRDYGAFGGAVAPATATLVVRRYHVASGPAAGVDYFRGDVRTIRIRGRVATIEIPSILERLRVQVPSIYWQGMCHHRLGEAVRCRVVLTSFRVPVSNVVSIDSTGTVITVTSVGNIPALGATATPEDYLKAGTMARVADGERRLIVSNNGTDNRTVTINRPFPDLQVGDALQLTAGCDHTIGTCASKFDNVVNFGGHPLVPRINLFTTDLRAIVDDIASGVVF